MSEGPSRRVPLFYQLVYQLVALCLGCTAVVTWAQEDRDDLQLVDRLVAVVDDDPVFLSDIDRLLALGLVELPDVAADVEVRRRVALDRLIDDRLRLHEVERYELGTVPAPQMVQHVDALAQSLGGRDALIELLAAQDMDLEALRVLLRRQLRILAFVEERLAPRVSVAEADVQAHYDTELRSEMAARGAPLPPLDEVREAIERVLYERALNREIEDWTNDLRRRAKVVDLLQRRVRDLPPVVLERDN